MSNKGMAILLVIIGFIITGVAEFISAYTFMYEAMLMVIYKITNFKNRNEVADAFFKDGRKPKDFMIVDEYNTFVKHCLMAIVIPILVVLAALGVVIKALTVVL